MVARLAPRCLAGRRDILAHFPQGFIGRLFGVGPGQWGEWLLYLGTLVAVIAVALIAMLAGSPVSRRMLTLLAIPFALGAVIYLGSLISPPPPASAGNALAVSPKNGLVPGKNRTPRR